MAMSTTTDVGGVIRASALDFRDVVWPAIAEDLGGGMLEPMECFTDSETAKRFDVIAGVDAWQWLPSGRGVRGIASRVQWWKEAWARRFPFNTYTVRRTIASGGDTEYTKRLYAILTPGLTYPYLTIQAYLLGRGGPICSIAAIRTADLIRSIDPSERGTPWMQATGGNTFFRLTWDALSREVPIWRWDDFHGSLHLSPHGDILAQGSDP